MRNVKPRHSITGGARSAALAGACLLPLSLAACGSDFTPPRQATTDQALDYSIDAEIARSTAQAAKSLHQLQEAEAPISGPPVRIRPVTSSASMDSAYSAPAPIASAPMATPAPVMTAPVMAAPVAAASMPAPVMTASATPAPVMSAQAPQGKMAPVLPQPEQAAPADVSGLPSELQQNTTLKWTGSVDGALRAVAVQIGYSYQPPAMRFPVEPQIVLNEHDKSVADVLQDIGLQIQKVGVVNVDTHTKTIALQQTRKFGKV